jgi:hypothetical protein
MEANLDTADRADVSYREIELRLKIISIGRTWSDERDWLDE